MGGEKGEEEADVLRKLSLFLVGGRDSTVFSGVNINEVDDNKDEDDNNGLVENDANDNDDEEVVFDDVKDERDVDKASALYSMKLSYKSGSSSSSDMLLKISIVSVECDIWRKRRSRRYKVLK